MSFRAMYLQELAAGRDGAEYREDTPGERPQRAMAKTKTDTKTTVHTVTIPIGENRPHALYLRESILHGTMPDGRAIELDQSGATLILQIGEWQKPGGRQFTICLTGLTQAIIDQLVVEPEKGGK